MTPQDRQHIIDYLSGPRDYAEGAALYMLHGCNLMVKRRLRIDPSRATHEMLIDALRRLAGLSEAQLARLPRRARRSQPQSPQQPQQSAAVKQPQNKAAETVQKMLRFRDRYPFLKDPDCPDALKVMVADMFTAYDRYVTAHERLQQLDDAATAESAELCRQTVEAYLDNRRMWDTLDYYAEHRCMPPARQDDTETPVEDLTAIDDLDLMKKLSSARTAVSKRRRALAALPDDDPSRVEIQAALDEWSARKAAIEAETERRKKK